MLSALDDYYLNQPEPTKSCMLALRDMIISMDENITLAWKYRMPFFCYGKKMCCYLWTDKNTKAPYIGIVEGNQMDHPRRHGGLR